ncbi:major facilitator superfamily transporter [Pseudogulbenkiania sp. NH8B]|uniref:MFS transporter n=1 Tax=Pseudogulbenkiania sp. (strain NH8B) TaxID=748280 RepID=UPI00022797E1|nr:MFS transporter [Pseudogulbenkiania sp. NH8B]BAK74925.1 major facilitator superfamily transporter [Pseudogulbenkiania sp. NH8B]
MNPASPAVPVSLRRFRPFWLYWLTRVCLTSGFQILTVAIGWQVYSLTGSALDLGLVGLLQFLPRVLLVLVVGSVVDRFDRQRIVTVSLLVQAAVAALLGLGSAHAGFAVSRELIFALSVLIGTCRSFDMPAMQALLPNVVPPALLPPAVAAAASANEAATILAPALGGFLYALGAEFTYGLDLTLYLGGALLLSRLAARPSVPSQQRMTLDSLLVGVRFIKSRPDILGAISLDLFAVLLGGATALLPIYARDILHTGPWGLGLLRSAPAVGALMMSAYLMRFPIAQRVGRVMFAAVAVFGLATIAFGLSTSFGLSLAALAVLGASDMISVVIRTTFVQLETPDEMRGRVSAVNSLFIGASNQLGEFESGATAALLGTVPAVVAGGVGTLLVAALWMRLFPTLAQRHRLVQGPAADAAG